MTLKCSVQTFTAGSVGSTLSPCICIERIHLYSRETTVLARYLFNVGDNLPRVAQENKVRAYILRLYVFTHLLYTLLHVFLVRNSPILFVLQVKLRDIRYVGLSSMFPHNMGG